MAPSCEFGLLCGALLDSTEESQHATAEFKREFGRLTEDVEVQCPADSVSCILVWVEYVLIREEVLFM